MPAMRHRRARRQLNAITVLSLLVALAAVALWIRSKCVTRIDIWELSPTRRVCVEGALIEIERIFPDREPSEQYEYTVIPYGLIGWAAAILPAARADDWLRRRGGRLLRHRARRCTRCGYNLTANVSGVCPECGTVIAEGAT